tara:strand:+ start:2356 stop:2718 length:363 start_codon:yes stop_codon:yes gene_type:complete
MHEIVKPMMEFRGQIKLYHWKTSSFARHKGTDKFLEKYDKLFDEFVEVMSGYRNEKIHDTFSVTYKKLTDATAEAYVIKFRDWVCHKLPTFLFEHETDLLNLKDEILANTNRLLYLMRLK